ncbi:hypothetical protein [Arcticibacterium luteifluviistationis]|uniref:Uncharacterized protein n=1 Tax=Arcticibacterium luteifluviistationis TaxID=1784714 RepID=A0A2Z4G6F8_9BACT|nr:hypothetical protein [Arcticibacterium luteifluviistationis]AWV96727.1 hypothetical protein DJ013_00375 [Arcticibacterium luteifluviistationis]
MKNRTAYIIKSNFSFYNKIFCNYGLKDSFKFLKSPTCLNDIICSNLSDINIYNGRFHLAAHLQYTDFYPQNRDDGKFNIPDFAKVRTKEEFEKYGCVEKAFKDNSIKYNHTKRAFINNIGEIKYSSKAHYHNCFSTQYLKKNKFWIAASIIKRLDSWLYGLIKNQNHSTIPLHIGNNLKVDVIYDRLKNKIVIGAKTITILHRLKVSLCPFGLLSISISYSITSNSYIDTTDLIIIQKIIEKDNTIIYKNKRFNSLNSLLEYIKSHFENSVFEVKEKNENENLGTVTTINFSNPSENIPSKKGIIGILDMDLNHQDYSSSYIDSYTSKFGKYENDITVFKNNRLLYLFDNKWNYMRAKTLFNWAFSDVYSSIYVKRKLLKIFSFKAQKLLEKSDKLSNLDKAYIKSLNQFLLNLEQYKKLPRPLRQLFYRFIEELNFDYKKETSLLKESLKTYKSNSKKDDFIDYFTLNPNFMGIGIDFNKIIRKITMKDILK